MYSNFNTNMHYNINADMNTYQYLHIIKETTKIYGTYNLCAFRWNVSKHEELMI